MRNPTLTDLANIHAEIVAHLTAGGRVMIGTYTRGVIYGQQHADWFTMGKDGNLYVRRGKGKDCLSCAGCLAVAVRLSSLAIEKEMPRLDSAGGLV